MDNAGSFSSPFNLQSKSMMFYHGNVIYHIPTKACEFSGNSILPSLMEKLESVQYTAALAITGVWKGMSRVKLYTELGWESLSSRCWNSRLTLFYKMINNDSRIYTRPNPRTSTSTLLFSHSGCHWTNEGYNTKI